MSNINPDDFQTLFQPGRMLEVGTVSFSTGGAVSNTGLAFHKLGINSVRAGDETITRIESGWSKHDEKLADFDWRYQAETQVWKPS